MIVGGNLDPFRIAMLCKIERKRTKHVEAIFLNSEERNQHYPNLAVRPNCVDITHAVKSSAGYTPRWNLLPDQLSNDGLVRARERTEWNLLNTQTALC